MGGGKALQDDGADARNREGFDGLGRRRFDVHRHLLDLAVEGVDRSLDGPGDVERTAAERLGHERDRPPCDRLVEQGGGRVCCIERAWFAGARLLG